MVDFVGEGGAERDAVLMLGTRGVDVLVGYGGRLDVEILSEGLFPETSFLSSIVGTYNEAVELVALVARGAVKLTKTTFPPGRGERRPARPGRRPDDRPRRARAQRELTRSTCGRFGRCETALTSIWRGPG